MLRTTSTIGTSAILLLTMASAVAAQEESSATPEADGSPSALSDEVMRLGSEVGPLEPGTYADNSLGPEVRFSVGAGWEMSGEPIDDVGVQLGRAGDRGGRGDHHPLPRNGLRRTVCPERGLRRLLRGHPESRGKRSGLRRSPRGQPVPRGRGAHGDRARRLVGAPGRPHLEHPGADCQPPVTFLWELPVVGEFHLVDQESARAIALDVGEDVVVIFIEANPGVDWPAFLEASMPLVESVSITSPDAEASPATTES